MLQRAHLLLNALLLLGACSSYETKCTMLAVHLKGANLAAAAGKQNGQGPQLQELSCCRAPSLLLLASGSPPSTTVSPAAPCCRAPAYLPDLDVPHHEVQPYLLQSATLTAAAAQHAGVPCNVLQVHRAPC